MQFKKFIDDIIIDLWFSRNFASIEDTRKKYNPAVNLSKFTSNKKILSKVVTLGYNKFWNQTLSKKHKFV